MKADIHNLEFDLLDSLNLIEGNGSFVTSHSESFVFPGLSVEDIGEIAYPINELMAKALIQKARKAPFGKGSETIIDDKVRSAWEIDPEKLYFKGGEWDKFLRKAMATIKPQLGIEDYEVEAHLYKLLIYQKGDFFLSHRDSEKEKGMFGTLIIGLPSKHLGGELLIRFDGEEKSVSFAESANNYKIPYVAFYADCEHEIKPITAGYRVCLVYNLIQKKNDNPIVLEALGEHVSRLTKILEAGKEHKLFSPRVVLLGHQYTPENFSKDNLKLNDRTKAEALIRAADIAGYYAKMCLVTSYLSGIPSDGGYGWDYEPDEDSELEEIDNEWISIEHWLDDGPPPLGHLEVEEAEILAPFRLNDGDPIVKESTGYMGNYGPDLMHWYHYGAVVFWPKKDHQEILLKQDISNQLEWINHYNSIRKQLSDYETATVETILKNALNVDKNIHKADFNVVADWLIGYNDDSCFERLGYRFLVNFFEKIKDESWGKLVEVYPRKHFEKIFKQVMEQGNISTLWHLLSVFKTLTETKSGRALVALEMQRLPEYFATLIAVLKKKPLLNFKAFEKLLLLENLLPQDKKWVQYMHNHLTKCSKRQYVNDILVQMTLKLEKKTPLAHTLLLFGKEELQVRVDNKPQAPADWSRPVPDVPFDAMQWQILANFLQSPEAQVFDYRKKESERSLLEEAIKKVVIDLRTETIKRGSPHTLRIIKTQAAYDKQMEDWREDVALLERVKRQIG
ncbi:2OG-Fe(II) oxygenase [Mongoliibacter ruber]|uniref:2-oxoglutarate-Fe(II)-dependent oxygenase superfamily protein n=1 Tax=Mongoliibacter ruber TaxID=1750599 RepID=A0A2T0WAQ9_9BACT|nr:2OG-Fe(II) oxygenase [Mongoliibacter ruber]PRY83788.1 hypothetical protein CLW00_1255 [Mongoliibacter ruber]